jgi:hypothetical protein
LHSPLRRFNTHIKQNGKNTAKTAQLWHGNRVKVKQIKTNLLFAANGIKIRRVCNLRRLVDIGEFGKVLTPKILHSIYYSIGQKICQIKRMFRFNWQKSSLQFPYSPQKVKFLG